MIKRILVMSLVAITLALGTFFFWGSASTINQSEYSAIYELNVRDTSIAEKDTFSILTYNLGYLSGMTNNTPQNRPKELFDENMAKSIQLLKDLKPDFVAFQEIDVHSYRSFYRNQIQEIGSSTGYFQAAQAINWDKRYIPFPYWPISSQFGEMVSAQAILSRYPILSNEIITLEKPANNPFYYNAFYIERLAQITQIKIGERDLIIINIHLEAFDAPTRDIQIQEVLKIYHDYAPTYPVILCGDFNSTLPNATHPYQDDQVLETLLRQPSLEMAINLEENENNEEQYFTFNSVNPDRRIDYFFYNPEFISVVGAKVARDAGQISDHLPVILLFELK